MSEILSRTWLPLQFSCKSSKFSMDKKHPCNHVFRVLNPWDPLFIHWIRSIRTLYVERVFSYLRHRKGNYVKFHKMLLNAIIRHGNCMYKNVHFDLTVIKIIEKRPLLVQIGHCCYVTMSYTDFTDMITFDWPGKMLKKARSLLENYHLYRDYISSMWTQCFSSWTISTVITWE